ncbi:MAG TPA: hypothetical protein DCY07_08580, partial [Rhodospirillaceae bacterium]|nr:hypothetical protein [Rhodospirillaceae bacterium]
MTKLATLMGGFMIVSAALIFLSLSHGRDAMMAERKILIRNMVEVASSQIAHYYVRASAGDFSVEEAQEKAKEAIRAVRYGGEGYLFIVDLQGVMIVHPIVPAFEGKSQIDLR